MGGRNEQLAETSSGAVARGQVIEQLADVAGDRRVCAEWANIRVDACCHRVIVAGAQMHVTAQPVVVATDHEHHFAVCLQSQDAVTNVDTGVLQTSGERDVRGLVEAAFSSTTTATCLPLRAACMR